MRVIWLMFASTGVISANTAMPVAEQNALVQKYCAVCHTDAHPNGRLSLEHFDAGHADPGIAAMLVSKLKGGALGAAGLSLPEPATRQALLHALTEEAEGSDKWTVSRADVVTASIVRQIPSMATSGEPTLYRLTLTCNPANRQPSMELAWSPGVPESGQPMSVSADGNSPVVYRVEGSEKMGNGQAGSSGPGGTALTPALPDRSLTIANLFPGDRVVFPFDELSSTTRQALAACFHQDQARAER